MKKIFSLIVIIIALMDAMTLTTTAFAEDRSEPLVKLIHVVILQWMLL
jgi:hypothetical protein